MLFIDLESRLASGGNSEQTVGSMFPVADAGGSADAAELAVETGFLAVANQDYAEHAVFPQAGGNHVEIARFENFQRQGITG